MISTRNLHPPSLQGEPLWYRALRLAERLEREGNPSPLPRADDDGDLDLALRRLADWRAQSPFGQEEWFSYRLRFDGLDEVAFLKLLGESDRTLRARSPEPPGWLLCLEERLLGNPAHSAGDGIPHGFFTPLLAGAIGRAFGQIRERAASLLREHGLEIFDPQTVPALLFSGMTERLDWILGRVVVLEMQVARLTGQLSGSTPTERFRNFLSALGEPGRWHAFLLEYPVLARLLAEALERWVEVSTELLARLCADWRDLRAAFLHGEDPGLLRSVTGGVGDSHAGGRAVRVLQFTKGARVVYKPRPMGVDVCFGALLAWLNERGAPDLRTAGVLPRGDYGWMEFVVAQSCQDREELRRFYRRQGAFLSLLYVLNANDFHRENLIAVGEHPILIDLESLCSPDYGRSDPATFDSLAQYELNDSVTRVMLLPFFHENKMGDVVDLSGLGGGDDELSAHEALVWEAAGTDEMRLVRQRLRNVQSGNRPTFSGRVVNPRDFRGDIEEGFISMYRLLLARRGELLADGSPLTAFRGETIRVILRATQFYDFILRESYHPDLLRDALDRDRHFDRLWFGMERTHFGDLARRLIPFEQEDLWRGDIPCFRAEAGSRDVRSSLGRPLPNLLARSGFEMVESRLAQLGEDDLDRQLLYVRNSLMASAMESGIGLRRYPPVDLQDPPAEPDRGRLLDWAAAAADRVEALAQRLDGAASWIGLAEIADRGWWLRAIDTDLYAGLPGVALFLAYFGAVTGEERFTRLGEETLPTLRTRIELRRRVRTLGAFDGWGGIVHTWTHLAHLWQRKDLLSEALDMVPRMAALVDSDPHLDLYRGSAGGILPLLHLARISGSDAPLAAARRMGDRLVAAARPFEDGLGWLVGASPLRPLTGFSHGAAGIAWALLELFGATGEERYRETAIGGIAFENGLFRPEKGNWPDLRGVSMEKTRELCGFMAAWCHGACGIGLSRLRMLRHLDDPRLAEDARIAVETTVQKGFGWCHALCHGDLGALELILEAARTLNDSRLEEERGRRLALLIASLEQHGFLSGLPGHVEAPGLMDGLAGIGLGLLRQAFPERVPSVLLLDPPAWAPGLS